MAKLIATVDDDVKAEAADLYTSMGMSLSTAINVFLRQSVREQGLPFTPTRADSTRRRADGLMDELAGLSADIPSGSPLAHMDRLAMRKEYEQR